jgi:hypothetical protein
LKEQRQQREEYAQYSGVIFGSGLVHKDMKNRLTYQVSNGLMDEYLFNRVKLCVSNNYIIYSALPDFGLLKELKKDKATYDKMMKKFPRPTIFFNKFKETKVDIGKAKVVNLEISEEWQVDGIIPCQLENMV